MQTRPAFLFGVEKPENCATVSERQLRTTEPAKTQQRRTALALALLVQPTGMEFSAVAEQFRNAPLLRNQPPGLAPGFLFQDRPFNHIRY